jgi:uncharacterized protein DUF6247
LPRPSASYQSSGGTSTQPGRSPASAPSARRRTPVARIIAALAAWVPDSAFSITKSWMVQSASGARQPESVKSLATARSQRARQFTDFPAETRGRGWRAADWQGRRLWHPPSAGPYYDAMTAQPAEHYEDPLDPERILQELPGRERGNFLAAYREALDGARDPAGWGHLRRVLRLWSGMVIAANRPGFYEAQEAALTGTGGGTLLEDYIRLRRTQA